MDKTRKQAYLEKLRDPRWQKKRLEVLQRDGWACTWCENEEATLHVHHLYYENNTDPWEYPPEALVTLCTQCHEKESLYRYRDEQGLLMALRKAGLMAFDILELAAALRKWGQFKNTVEKDYAVTALTWALEQPEVIDHITDLYFDYLREKHPRRTDGPGKPDRDERR